MLAVDSVRGLLLLNAPLRFMSLSVRGVRLGRGSWLKCPLTIGEGSGMGWNCTARGTGRLTIGKYSAIGESVRFITSNHCKDSLTLNFLLQDRVLGRRILDPRQGISIGHDVWIGDRAILLPGVEIGNGAIIGAGAVVSRSVAPYTIVAGCPAKLVGQRFPNDVVAALQRLQWWEWSLETMRANRWLFAEGGVSNENLKRLAHKDGGQG